MSVLDRVVTWLSLHLLRRRIRQYVRWCDYEIGPLGFGPFGPRPTFPKPRLPVVVARQLDRCAAVDAQQRRDAFRETCLDVLGEDPDDWGRS